MKPVSNKEIAVIFKEAKKYLAKCLDDNLPNYICFAIDKVAENNHTKRHSCSRAKRIINERLGKSFTVFNWLVSNGFMKENNFEDINHHEHDQLQKYRHRWLDSLIKEFSA